MKDPPLAFYGPPTTQTPMSRPRRRLRAPAIAGDDDGDGGGAVKPLSVLRLVALSAMLAGALVMTGTPSSPSPSPVGPRSGTGRSGGAAIDASRFVTAEQHQHHLRAPKLSSLGSDKEASDADSMKYETDNPDMMRLLQAGDGCSSECCRILDGGDAPAEEESWVDAIPFPVQIILTGILLSLSALFSGLTLGLLSLDLTGLEIVMAGDNEREAKAAKVIYPVRKKGNLLLCTLLLGNVAVNALLSILLAEVAGGLVGFLSSTFLIVIFGEIVPQALCSRYALTIGSATVPLVKVIRCLVWPVAAPLAWCLDKALGRELVSTYSTAEMLKLLQIHQQENIIDKETAGAMTGALTFKDMLVKDVMTPLERTFMLSVDEKLSFETIAKIFRTGYSRIPVYEVSPNNVIGLLFVKDLIFIDPEDDTPIRSFIQIFGRGVHVVWPDDKLGGVLAELKQGRSHLALVRDVNNEDPDKDSFYEVKGIITLEDIIEKILGDTIVDETDAFIDNSQSTKVDRGEGFDWSRLRLLDSKIVDEMLSIHEVKAVSAHLRMNHASTFERLSDSQLQRLVACTPVSNLTTAERKVGRDLPDELLYEKGVDNDTFTLVLSGKVAVVVGSDRFRSDVSSWSVLGASALSDPSYAPDFSAYVSDGPCRCLRITRDMFISAVEASVIERQHGGPPGPGSSAGVHFGGPTSPKNPTARREKLLTAMRIFRQSSSNVGPDGGMEAIDEKPDGDTDDQSSGESSKPSASPPAEIESTRSFDETKPLVLLPPGDDADKRDDPNDDSALT